MATMTQQQTSIQRIENSLLIWFDESIDETSDDFNNTQLELRRVANSIDIFKEEEACIQFIKEQTKEKLNIIVSNSMGPTFVPRIHSMPQVNSIFIFNYNGTHSAEDWARVWAKIRGLFSSISFLCEELRKTKKTCEQNCVSFSLVKTQNVSLENVDQLEPLFMYTQLIKEIILSIKFDRKYLDEYLEYCRNTFKDNYVESENVKDMAENYKSKSSIWWYTKESFLYPMLNRALRLTDIDIILKLAFFIQDLHQELDKLCRKEFSRTSTMKSFTVYRGQCLSEEDMEKVRQAKDGLIAFTNFLSTSKQREVSMAFARSSLEKNPTMVGLLYVMEINPLKATTSFASIESVSAIKGEDEILFSMNSIFRIGDIRRIDEHERLFQVNLTLSNEDDKDLRQLTNHIRQKNYPTSEPWFRLGFLVKTMGHLDKAKELFQTLLDQKDDAKDKATIYFELAAAHGENGEPKEALALYAKYLIIQRKLVVSNPFNLAAAHHNIGQMYYNLGDYSKALDYYKKALDIREKSLPSNHPDLAVSYNNIAGIYEKMNDNKTSLEYSKKALKISQRSSTSIDPDLAKSYANIGLQHYNTGDFSQAMNYYQKALEIQRKSLTPYHPDLAMCYNNIAGVYQAMNDYKNALEYMKKSHDIRKQSLKPNHPEMGMSYNNIGFICERIGNYAEARSNYKIAVEIAQKSLPPHHPHRLMWTMNLRRINNG